MATDVQAGLLLRMEATLAKFEKQMAKGRKLGRSTATGIQADFDRMNGRVSKSAEKSAAVITKAIERSVNDYERLASSLDPVVAAKQRLTSAEKVLDQALLRGVITTREHTRMMRLARSEHEAATTAISVGSARATGGLSGFLNVSKGSRSVLQGLSYQLSDVAVQAEMGVDPMRIMAQQGSQVAGSFAAIRGPLGLLIPIFGSLAAVGLPVIAMLMNMGDESEETEKKIENFADALDAADAAISRASASAQTAGRDGLADLEKHYGIITEKVRDLALALAEIEQRAAKASLDQLLDFTLDDKYVSQVENMFGVVGAAVASAGSKIADEQADAIRQAIRELESEIAVVTSQGAPVPGVLKQQMSELKEELAAVEGRLDDIGSLASELGVSPEVLKTYSELETRLNAAREAGDFMEIADSLNEMRNVLSGVGDVIDQGVKDKLAKAEAEARKLAKAAEEAQTAATEIASDVPDIATGLNPAVLAAQNLAKWLGVSLETAKRMIALGPQGTPDGSDGKVYSGRGGDPREQGGRIFDWQTRDAGNWEPPKKSGKTSTPSDLVEMAEKELTAMQRRLDLMGKTKSEIAGLTLKHRLLDEAKANGLDLDKKLDSSGQTLRQTIEGKAQALEQLAEKYERTSDKAEFYSGIQEQIKNGLLDAIVEADNFSDALKNVGRAFKRAAWEALLFNQGPYRTKDGGGGLLGGIIGGLFGFSEGGYTGPGGKHEPAGVVHKGEVVFSQDDVAKMGGVAAVEALRTRGLPSSIKSQSIPDFVAPQGGNLKSMSVMGKMDVRIFVDDDGKIGALVEDKAGPIAAEIVRAGITEYDSKVMPGRVNEITADPLAV